VGTFGKANTVGRWGRVREFFNWPSKTFTTGDTEEHTE
jgi:hypothetical protein